MVDKGSCIVPRCKRKIDVKLHGLCIAHYRRWCRTGNVGGGKLREYRFIGPFVASDNVSQEIVPRTKEEQLEVRIEKVEIELKPEIILDMEVKEIKAEPKFTLPDWVPLDAWNDFVEHRRKIKSPLTDLAVKLNIKDLDKFRKDGDDPKAVLEQSIKNGWKGVFPLRDNKKLEAIELDNQFPSINEALRSVLDRDKHHLAHPAAVMAYHKVGADIIHRGHDSVVRYKFEPAYQQSKKEYLEMEKKNKCGPKHKNQ